MRALFLTAVAPFPKLSMILTMNGVPILALMLAVAAACTTTESPTDRPTVVAAFYPVAEAAERVGGDRVDVVNLTAAGTEPHDLELGPNEVVLIGEAAVVLYLGGGLQPGIEDALREREGPSVDLLAGITLRDAEEDEHEEEGEEHAGEEADPHVWLDPHHMIAIAEGIRDALGAADPDNAETYEVNAEAYLAELEALDRDFSEGLAVCTGRTMVVSHAAFGYLGGRYGLEQHAITGISPDDEPSARRLAQLAELVRDEGITTVFTETLVDPSVARTLADEAGVATAVLDPIEGLSGEQLAAGEDYATVMRANLETLRAALGCT